MPVSRRSGPGWRPAFPPALPTGITSSIARIGARPIWRWGTARRATRCTIRKSISSSTRIWCDATRAANHTDFGLMLVNLAVLQELIAGWMPDREAIVWRDRGLTYGGLTARTRRVGRALRRFGLGCRRERAALQPWESGQDHVAILAYHCPEWIELMY